MSELSPGGNGIRITNRELYDIAIQVRDRVHALENRVDNVLSENVDLRRRVRSLELKTYTLLAGGITALLAVVRVGLG